MNLDQLTLFAEEPLVKDSHLQDLEKDWMMTVATWHSSFSELLLQRGPVDRLGERSRCTVNQTKEGTLEPFSEGWKNSGMGGHTEHWTLSTLEWTGLEGLFLKDEGVSSLSDILETGDRVLEYCLTPIACQGILRRAERRSKEGLPELLKRLLQQVALALVLRCRRFRNPFGF